jgi:hypothetical protein
MVIQKFANVHPQSLFKGDSNFDGMVDRKWFNWGQPVSYMSGQNELTLGAFTKKACTLHHLYNYAWDKSLSIWNCISYSIQIIVSQLASLLLLSVPQLDHYSLLHQLFSLHHCSISFSTCIIATSVSQLVSLLHQLFNLHHCCISFSTGISAPSVSQPVSTCIIASVISLSTCIIASSTPKLASLLHSFWTCIITS